MSPGDDLAPGDAVHLVGDEWWGYVVEIVKKWRLEGARVIWTHTGEISWTPLSCLEKVD